MHLIYTFKFQYYVSASMLELDLCFVNSLITARPRLTCMTGPEINRINRKPRYFFTNKPKNKNRVIAKTI